MDNIDYKQLYELSQALNVMNVDRMTIYKCCNDKYVNYKTCKGFIWKY